MSKKLRELTLYVAGRSKGDPAFGLTKLNKILFISDFYFYGIRGESITGAKYVHRKNGPTPRTIHSVIESLTDKGKAHIEEIEYFGYSQKRLVPLIGADTSGFSEDELTFVDNVIGKFEKFNASDLSDWSHTLNPWLLTDEEEEIPYCSAFVMHRLPVEKAGITWAKEELRWIKKEGVNAS